MKQKLLTESKLRTFEFGDWFRTHVQALWLWCPNLPTMKIFTAFLLVLLLPLAVRYIQGDEREVRHTAC